MTWVDIAWPAMAGASLALGLIHALMWFRQRDRPALLIFGLAAAAAAVLAIFELLLMRAQTPQQYMAILRLAHIPVALLGVALVGFVLLHFRAGRLWLGVLACALRIATTVPSFLEGGSLRFRNITELARVEFWGGVMVAVPVGHFNPLSLATWLGDLLLVWFLADVIVTVRKHTQDPFERRRVVLVCGSMIAFVVVGSTWPVLVAAGWLHAPLTVIVPFLIVLGVMSLDLGDSAVRATTLAQRLEDSELHLRESEQRFRFTATAVGIGLWTWDLGSRESWFTLTGSDLLGLPSGKPVVTDTFLARLDPEARVAIEAAYEEAVHHTGRFECQYPLQHPNGGIRWISAKGRVEHSDTGTPVRIRGVVLDITDRHKAEERFRLVVDSSPAAILMIDAEGRVVLANAQAERVFGYDAAEFPALGVDALVPSLATSRTVQPGREQTGPVRVVRSLFGLRKDGSRVPIEVTLDPVDMPEGRRFELASITDISERLRLEHEVSVQRSELAHLSRISLLGEMSSSLAHELSQPLTAVLSNAQAALRFLDREVPDLLEVRDGLLQVVENDKRAGEVIQRLRSMLRKERIEYRKLDINDIVGDVLRLTRSDLLNRKVEVVQELSPELPAISGDPVQLQQVLVNLVVNACDAMDATGHARTLGVKTRLTGDGTVEVSVSDVGCGISDADLPRIFDPFVTTKKDGLSLGLVVCRTIVRAHHGTMWATKNPARGTTLHVVLPPLGEAASDPVGNGAA